jgi:hypothetical protein
MIKPRVRNLFLASIVAAGMIVSGGVAAGALTVTGGTDAVHVVGVADEQTSESVNDNQDQKDVANHDDGQVGQVGESVNDNVDQKDSGNHDDAQVGQAGEK